MLRAVSRPWGAVVIRTDSNGYLASPGRGRGAGSATGHLAFRAERLQGAGEDRRALARFKYPGHADPVEPGCESQTPSNRPRCNMMTCSTRSRISLAPQSGRACPCCLLQLASPVLARPRAPRHRRLSPSSRRRRRPYNIGQFEEALSLYSQAYQRSRCPSFSSTSANAIASSGNSSSRVLLPALPSRSREELLRIRRWSSI